MSADLIPTPDNDDALKLLGALMLMYGRDKLELTTKDLDAAYSLASPIITKTSDGRIFAHLRKRSGVTY